jgi:hypothetical protein
VPNQGYLSEAGASLVDRTLGLNVVPLTKVVRYTSPSFHYGKLKRYRATVARSAAEHFPEIGKHMKQGLPAKVGSLQTFVYGYKVCRCAVVLFSDIPTGCIHPTPTAGLPETVSRDPAVLPGVD